MPATVINVPYEGSFVKDIESTTTNLLALSVLLNLRSSPKRKREVSTENVAFDSILFYEVVYDLDAEDCIAMAVCYSHSINENDRKHYHKDIIRAFGMDPRSPPKWTEFSTTEAKYRYAAFVGETLKTKRLKEGCKEVFSTCPVDVKYIFRVLCTPSSGQNNDCSSDSQPMLAKIKPNNELSNGSSEMSVFVTI